MDLAIKYNSHNLNAFWQSLTAVQSNGLNHHLSWPNKSWYDDFSAVNKVATAGLTSDKTFCTIADVTECGQNSFKIKSQLVMMNLTLQLDETANHTLAADSESIITVIEPAMAEEWAQACSQAFGYEIDAEVIKQLLNNSNASIFAYMVKGEIAGTAISYQTDGVLGIHQLGTLPNYRKMGIAAALMQHLLALAHTKHCQLVTLQASQAGLHLYQQLGFESVGKLTAITAQ